MTIPSTLADIQNKIRRITARPSQNQLSDTELNKYINTALTSDLPNHLKLEPYRVNYQFVTQPYQGTYDVDTDIYLQTIPPVFCGGYQIPMTQNREQFYRAQPKTQFLEAEVAIGTGVMGAVYTGTLSNVPLMKGYDTNPGGQLVDTFNYNVMFAGSVTSGAAPYQVLNQVVLVDNGDGDLRFLSSTAGASDPIAVTLANPSRGKINYVTGTFQLDFLPATTIDKFSSITAQYTPYKASRPTCALYYQDQITLFPIPDQAYVMSFEAFKKPIALIASGQSPELKDLWQLIAYIAADKIFSDNGDMENVNKYRPILDEQLRLCNRRSITQYSIERVATIYTEQSGPMFPFNTMFYGM